MQVGLFRITCTCAVFHMFKISFLGLSLVTLNQFGAKCEFCAAGLNRVAGQIASSKSWKVENTQSGPSVLQS